MKDFWHDLDMEFTVARVRLDMHIDQEFDALQSWTRRQCRMLRMCVHYGQVPQDRGGLLFLAALDAFQDLWATRIEREIYAQAAAAFTSGPGVDRSYRSYNRSANQATTGDTTFERLRWRTSAFPFVQPNPVYTVNTP